ncbi:MAG: glycosyltransferase family 9 protein [Deltaproteobacteria bacterium]|nr:glycosyltransferase family 9 protein [Deltaproteobacteria bacterium]MBW2083247.1 glycosyltransferase family 9 protein [Deltaproteobacteria bacterium]
MASPMLSALKKALPHSHVAWLLDPASTDLLRHHPMLDEIIIWDKKQWVRLWKSRRLLTLLKSISMFMRQLRSRQFDLALEAQGLLRSRLLVWMSGAREKIGFESKEPGEFLLTRVISRGPHNKQMSSEYYCMMREIGINPKAPFRPHLVVPQDCTETYKEKLLKKGVQGPYALLCPFTTRPQKHWFNDRWAQLAMKFKEQFSLPSVLMGGPGDLDSGDKIAESSKGAAVNLAGQTKLGEAMAIVKGASIMVGVDTGLTHMGAAFDVPTVALFGATCPYLHTWTPSFVVLYHKLDCSPCKRSPTCNGTFQCMDKIQVEEVIEAANKVLSL